MNESTPPQPAPNSISGKSVLLGTLVVGLILEVLLMLFVFDVRRRKSPPVAPPVEAGKYDR